MLASSRYNTFNVLTVWFVSQWKIPSEQSCSTDYLHSAAHMKSSYLEKYRSIRAIFALFCVPATCES